MPATTKGVALRRLAAVGLATLLCASVAWAGKSYTVKEGDNLWTIARKHNTTVEKLCQVNRLKETSTLKVGQRLVIPGVAKPSASKASKSGAPAPQKQKATPQSANSAKPKSQPTSRPANAPPLVGTLSPASAPKGYISGDRVNLRAAPTTECRRVATLDRGAVVRLLGKYQGFYRVQASSQVSGWVLWRYIKTQSADRVPRLVEASKTKRWAAQRGQQGDKGRRGATVNPPASEPPGKDRPVVVDGDTARFLKSLEELTDEAETTRKQEFEPLLSAPSMAERPLVREQEPAQMQDDDKGSGEDLVAMAMAQRGKPYRRGQQLPSRGFDCSGLVYWILNAQGVKAPRTAASLFGLGKPISRSELKEGDLVFFTGSYRRGISHVGIYVGDGKFIHSSSGAGGVVISSLNEGYYNSRFAGARRIK